eukprot:Nitzschia sp. Nitz4//scaffold37_size175936//134430//135302//NITZ4_002061-RA/size175936-processed-gene-0.230-mRNA-1//-1//CDS//3329549833//8880//frame0
MAERMSDLEEASSILGLSIGDFSDSCSSCLSDSESSGYSEDGRPLLGPSQHPFSASQLSLSNGDLTRLSPTDEADILLGGTSKARPRTRASRQSTLEEVSSGPVNGEDARLLAFRRTSSYRFYMIVSCLVLVSLSFMNSQKQPSIELIIHREEVVVPFHSSPTKPARGLQLPSEVLPKYILEAEENYDKRRNGEFQYDSSGSHQEGNTRKVRSNMAMARSQDLRPVFQAASPELQRLVMQNSSKPEPASTGRSIVDWISWMATLAVVAMLLDAGYKEYRQSLVEQHQRRR